VASLCGETSGALGRDTYVINKKANGKVVAHKVGKMKEELGWNQPIWVLKKVITNMKGPQMVWVPKAT
jgi:hypothetical protein